jgi:DNA polymerase III delta prime subunit
MKYYETHFEEYISSVEKNNLHPELYEVFDKFPKNIEDLENLIIYGPPGTGKYSQVLNILKKYSPSELKYDKKITANTEKQQYTYRISDIHFEIDMSLLGCNSKILWHEIFFQIVDIISVKSKKIGIILCKNFHLIHAELLEIFYSYIQQYNHKQTNIKIKFFLMMEQISFLPTPIINSCHILKLRVPNKDIYKQMIFNNKNDYNMNESFINRISEYKNKNKNETANTNDLTNNSINIIDEIEIGNILNIKETRFFPLVPSTKELPKEAFNIICDNIIKEIIAPNNIIFTSFRDTLYEILTYNLDMAECLWYIITYLINNEYLKNKDISDTLKKTYTFSKYYNNNYRPIYHLESIIFYIINKVHNFNEL